MSLWLTERNHRNHHNHHSMWRLQGVTRIGWNKKLLWGCLYRRVLFDRLGHGRQHFNNTGTLNKTGLPLFRGLVVSCTEKPDRHWRWETCCAKTWLYSCSCYDDVLPVIVLGILVSSSLFCIRLLICSYVGSLQYWQVIPFVDPGVWANFS